jgi:glycosyltransferase involved in cell wall biosynthesis
MLSRLISLPRDLRESVPTLRAILHHLGGALRDRLRHTVRRERKLRIGVDIRPFYEPLTGVGWYLHYLLHELAKHDDVELLLFGDARITGEGPRLHAELPANARYCTFDLRDVPGSRYSRSLSAAAYVAWMEIANCDVWFGSNYFLPRLHSAVARRRVVTVHDLTYKRFPELLQKETLDNLEATMQRELGLADAIICVSEATRRDLLTFYDIDPSRAVTIHSGLGKPLEAEPIALPPRYLLFVSTIEPRKNLGVLFGAFESLKERGAYDGKLVVVGRIGWKSEEIVRRMRTSRWRDDIVHLDYLHARQLVTVYQRAELFVFPSIYEGFGFPLLEAMAHGVPTIAARSSSLPEIGGDASMYFDPTSSTELAYAIEQVTTNRALHEDLVSRGRARVEHFRWDRAADQTLAVLRRVAGR